MKRFVLKTIQLIILICVIFISYFLVCLLLLKPLNTDAIYIWGDSQTYQGLQLHILSEATQCPVYSAAAHGGGMYDFLVFANNVPTNSTCIIGFSEACLYRKINLDNNRSGVNITALNELYHSGYPWSEWIRIFRQNRGTPKHKFCTTHEMIAYADTICISEPLDLWCNMFAREEAFHRNKQRAFLLGVEQLHNKGCTLIFVSFPLHECVEECASSSINRKKTIELKLRLLDNYHIPEKTLILESDSLLMHDLSHLNEIGARITTKMLADSVLINKKDCFVSINLPKK